MQQVIVLEIERLKFEKELKKIKILFWKCEKESFIFASAFGRKATEKQDKRL